jgi:argininosuccinate lyase
MMRYTAGEDRALDARLLPWDILGSIGHAEGLLASGLLTRTDHARLVRGLREALAAARRGALAVAEDQEDVHSAVENWLTGRIGAAGARLHAGRSRNDQVAVDLRLYLKDALLRLHAAALDLTGVLFRFAHRHRSALWPGYSHQRRAMPSSAGLWAAGLGEGILVTAESLPALWARVDRSPLGSAAGYGAPLPLAREAAMRALGLGGLDHVVTSVQGGRGKLEAAVLFWCVEIAHDLSRLSADVVLWSADEFGYLVLPPDLSTGSSIMPHKRNPDLFELTRARAAALEGDLAAALAIKAKLTGGYHRDFQLLKEPLFRGLDRTAEMLAMTARAVPRLRVDRARALAALAGGVLATDEVMRRVEKGEPFRAAYRAVGARLGEQERAAPPPRDLIRARTATGSLGNLALAALRSRLRAARRWNRREAARFGRAVARLAGSAHGAAMRQR